MERVDDDLLAYARPAASGARLNVSASALWFLSDGRERLLEIEARLRERYRGQSARVAADLRSGVAALQASGLVEVARSPATARPLLAVGFCNFRPGFDPRDSYFAWMLTHRFDVVLVDPRLHVPEVLFYSTHPATDFDHRHADRSLTKKVFVDGSTRPPDFRDCDFAITSGAVEARFTNRHQQLPWLAVVIDWNRYHRSVAAWPEAAIPAAYEPANVCSRLHDFLVAEPGIAAEAVTDPPPLRVDPEPERSAIDAVPAVAPSRPRKLTIGMATYNDFDGVYFTVLGIRLFHPEVTGDTEIVLIDDNPDGPAAQALRTLADSVEGCRYVASRETHGTAVRDLVFREARSPYVMCVDSHVLLAPGAIRRLIEFLDAEPRCADLLQGPLVRDDLTSVATHFEPRWSHGMYGVWGRDERGADPDNPPFEIPMQGLGVFACRRQAWLGFNPRFIGFGGEEGYIHEKFRHAGRRTLCLPFLRWSHRFQRPLGVPYRNSWEDRIRNYLIGWHELGLDTAAAEAHFRERLGSDPFERIAAEIRQEIANPFSYFDAIYCINLDEATERWRAITERFRRLGIAHRVRRFRAVETPESHHIGCALSHRRIVERAKQLQLENVLVIEDDALFLDDTLEHLGRSVAELRTCDWHVFHLGGATWRRNFPTAPGCQSLRSPCRELTCTHAVAYRAGVYDVLLEAMPADVDGMRAWIARHRGIDQYLGSVERRYLATPAVSSQPALLPHEPPELRERFS